MAFGIDAGITRNTQNTVQVAEKTGPLGQILDMTTFGGATEVQTEEFADSLTNEAVNGQNGTEVTTAHGYNESNGDYARVSKTVRTALTQPV